MWLKHSSHQDESAKSPRRPSRKSVIYWRFKSILFGFASIWYSHQRTLVSMNSWANLCSCRVLDFEPMHCGSASDIWERSSQQSISSFSSIISRCISRIFVSTATLRREVYIGTLWLCLFGIKPTVYFQVKFVENIESSLNIGTERDH